MRVRSALISAIVLSIACSLAQANDWPQWRGPERTGVSHEGGLLSEWPEDGPPMVWRVDEIGDGYSTPTIVGNRLFLLSNEGLENELVRAYSTEDGHLIWTTRIGKVGNPEQRPPYPGARSTPTVDGDLLYALGSDGDLACLEVASGNLRWQRNLRTDFGGDPGEWAFSESPLVDGDAVVCTPGGTDATIVKLNKMTGELIWKSPIPHDESSKQTAEAGYASIVIVNTLGRKQYVQFLQRGLVGVDAQTGEFLWLYPKTAESSPANIPTPVADNGYIYSAAGRSGGGLVKLVADNGKIKAEEVYFSNRLPTSLGGGVLVDGFLYGTNSQALMCVEFTTGEIRWQNRAIGAASLCYADGHLYLHGENGEVALVEATPEEYRQKGHFTPVDLPERGDSRAWAHPVIADGKLYIRDWNVLWCYDVRAAARRAPVRR